MSKFPVHEFHADVQCFKCNHKLSGQPIPSGYEDRLHNPPGHGRYRQYCGDCRLYTYYDIAEPASRDYKPNLLKRAG